MVKVPDLINGGFSVIGSILCWINVYKLYTDKEVEGVFWQIQGFFALWGAWHLYYFAHLGQWVTVLSTVLLFLGNLTWTSMACYYYRRKKNDRG